jgi:hypothetical protein
MEVSHFLVVEYHLLVVGNDFGMELSHVEVVEVSFSFTQ